MKDIQQLIKKNSQEGRYEDIFPKTFLDAVIDKESGESLTNILSGFNMYFLSYVGSSESTRLQVPISLRKTGLWITYVKLDDTIVTEWYAAKDTDDVTWQNSTNWKTGLVTNVWMNYRGYTNERPLLSLVDDGYPFYDRTLQKYICWNGTQWVNFDGTSLS